MKRLILAMWFGFVGCSGEQPTQDLEPDGPERLAENDECQLGEAASAEDAEAAVQTLAGCQGLSDGAVSVTCAERSDWLWPEVSAVRGEGEWVIFERVVVCDVAGARAGRFRFVQEAHTLPPSFELGDAFWPHEAECRERFYAEPGDLRNPEVASAAVDAVFACMGVDFLAWCWGPVHKEGWAITLCRIDNLSTSVTSVVVAENPPGGPP